MLRNFNSYYLNCRGRYAIIWFILVFHRLEVFGFQVIISWFAYRDNLWQQECYRKTTLDTIYRSACSNVKSDIWPILWQLCRQRNLDEWQKKCLFLYGVCWTSRFSTANRRVIKMFISTVDRHGQHSTALMLCVTAICRFFDLRKLMVVSISGTWI